MVLIKDDCGLKLVICKREKKEKMGLYLRLIKEVELKFIRFLGYRK